METISVRSLTKDYGGGKGIFDISLSIRQGEVYGFLGPNGAGKSTTIRHLMGFCRPDSGRAEILGIECFRGQKAIQPHVGYLPGEIALPDDMTGTRYLKLIGKMRKMKEFGYAQELARRFSINPDLLIKRMSKGMKQKVAIISAFMHDPDILLLDEPTSGLDPLMQNRFVELVEEEKNKGKTIFLSSHIFEEVEKTCDRVGILRGGKLIRDITIDELRSSQMTTYQIGFSGISDLRKFQTQYPDAHCAKNALQLTISIPDSQINPLISALSQCGLRFLREEKHTLEEYFMQFYGGEEHV
ncbi:ABC transporter ATP-binding protein [Zhenpiania hominis]|uniref:ABC transporter ATP-binding protein n=1 Tax=Zhenpiania hominis TaxID=2763644 RepID=UPI0039F4ED0B